MQDEVIDGKYRVIRELGRGGMGTVYEAVHLGTGRRVALKVILSEALLGKGDIVARFEREARASGGINSQHVVQVIDRGIDAVTRRPYMVMEFLVGEDVHRFLRRVGVASPEVALRIAAQACLGLQRAHEAGIVHRDVKSANMYLARRDGGEVVVTILDFGIAKIHADQFSTSVESLGLTSTGTLLGSPLYMSPEQAKGTRNLDARSDIWSLGVVLHEMLCGVTPHAECQSVGALILAICSEAPKPLQQRAPWVRPEVAAIVHKALALELSQRFQTAAEMHASIVALLPESPRIYETMLGPIPPHARTLVAPRLDMRSYRQHSSLASPYSPAGRDAKIATNISVTTTVPASPSTESANVLVPRRRSLRWTVTLAGMVALVVGGAWRHLERGATPGNARSTGGGTMADVAGQSAAGPTVSSATSTAMAFRPLELSVRAPAGAAFEVDGVSSALRDGGLEVSGAAGSMHDVTIASGARDRKSEVVISQDGLVPAHAELAFPSALPAHAVRRASPLQTSTAAMSTTAPVLPQAPKPNLAGGPAIDRSF